MLQRTPQAFINACFSLLWNSGYSVTVESDLHGWVEFMSRDNPPSAINAAFNPEFHRFDTDNSFWVSVRRRSDSEIIACICDRLIETDDFMEEQRSMRLWYNDSEALGVEPLQIAQSLDAYPDVFGKIGHHGGLWVDKTERHNGLAWLLVRAIRAMTLQRWPDTAWHCGTSLQGVAARNLPNNTYGYTRCDLLVDGWFEPAHSDQKVFMTSISQAEMLKQIGSDLSLIEMNPQQQVRDVVRVARERQSDAPVLAAVAG